MLSLELIRKDPDYVKKALLTRGEQPPIDELLEIDKRRRQAIQRGDELRARRNETSKEIAQMKEKPQELIEQMRSLGDEIKRLEQQAAELDSSTHAVLMELPNIPIDDVPIGAGEEDNVVVRTWGDMPSLNFTSVPHWELAESLRIIDFHRGAKLSGSRFFVMMGMGAKLERALINWMLDLHTTKHGYKEVYLPAMVKKEVMEGSGNLPKFGDNLYHDAEDDLWMIPTAEVPLTSLHRDEILPPGSLPLRYTAYTPCFRREKAAAGRDTRGIKRVQQFDKVEMYKFVEPETSDAELEKLVADAEEVCKQLGLHYRVLQLCTGDLGFASAKSFDLDVWAPGCGEWLEVSSCSNCRDFQARRAKIRYRPEPEARPEYVHTLNGSGLALPRVVIAILENYQQPDGSVVVPEVLIPYLGAEIIRPE